MWIYSTNLLDYLGEHGLKAECEICGICYFNKSKKLDKLLTRYTIIQSCFNGYKP